MPEDLRLRIGPEVGTILLTGTPAILSATLNDFFEEMGMSLEGTNEEKMVRLLEHLREYVRIRAKARRKKKKDAANELTVTAEVDAEISF